MKPLNHFTTLDKFAQFKVNDDFVFPIDNLHLALEMRELELKQKQTQQEAQQEQLPDKEFTIKEKYTSAFQFDAQLDELGKHEIGFLHELGQTFKSTLDDIRKSYLTIIEQILKQTRSKLQGEEKEKNATISFNHDKFILSEILAKINAFKVLTDGKERKAYLNRIRLRSMASQYLNITDMLKDGHFFPFLIFSVYDVQSNEARMIEIDFVDDVLHDRFKDHSCRSYHFSMIKRVNKSISQNNDEFSIEFNNKKYSYRAVVSTQANFIVAMLQVAIEETQIVLNKSKSVNCPDNQNIQKDHSKQLRQHLKRTQNSLGLKCIMNDQVLPTRTVRHGKCQKKNAVFGKAVRYLLLGTGQLVIARDPDFNYIVNVVPLEGGYCLVMQPNNKQTDADFKRTIHLITLQRLFEFSFETEDETKLWLNDLYMVLSSQIKSQSYVQKIRDQEKALSSQNKVAAYNDIHKDLVEELKLIQQLLEQKSKIETENYQEIEHLNPTDKFDEINTMLGNIWKKNQANSKNLEKQKNQADEMEVQQLTHKLEDLSQKDADESMSQWSNDRLEKVVQEVGADKIIMTKKSYEILRKRNLAKQS